MKVLEVKELNKVYTTRFNLNKCEALRSVSFDVEEGDFVAIMGESGSGKSTLLNIIASLLKPTAGTVILNGKKWQMSRTVNFRHFAVTIWVLYFKILICWIISVSKTICCFRWCWRKSLMMK